MLLLVCALICKGVDANSQSIDTIPCNDSIVYQNPFVYGGRQLKACAVSEISPRIVARRTVSGNARYGICDHERLSRLATRDAWEKCGKPIDGVIRVSDWKVVCLDHTYGSDSGSTAAADFACL